MTLKSRSLLSGHSLEMAPSIPPLIRLPVVFHCISCIVFEIKREIGRQRHLSAHCALKVLRIRNSRKPQTVLSIIKCVYLFTAMKVVVMVTDVNLFVNKIS